MTRAEVLKQLSELSHENVCALLVDCLERRNQLQGIVTRYVKHDSDCGVRTPHGTCTCGLHEAFAPDTGAP